MTRSLLIGSAAFAAVCSFTLPAAAASPQEDLVTDWIEAMSFGLPVSIGSSSFDPASQSVVLENVMVGGADDAVRVSIPGLTVEDPRLTPDGMFAAHAMRVDNLSAEIEVDLRAWFPDLAATADAGRKAEGETPPEESFPDAPFTIVTEAETMFYERVVYPARAPDLSGATTTFERLFALTRWSRDARADWSEASNMRVETRGAPDGDYVTTYAQYYMAGLHDGRAERSGYTAMAQTPVEGNTAAPVKSYTVGNGFAIGIDFGAYIDVIDPAAYAGGAGDGRWREVVVQTGVNEIAIEFDGGAMTVGSAEMNGMHLRQTDKPLVGVLSRMFANPAEMESDPLPYVRDLLPAMTGLFRLDHAAMWNVEFSAGADTSFKTERFDLNSLSSDGMGALTVRGVEARTPEGSVALDLLTLNNMRFGDLMAWIDLGAAAEASESGEPDPAAIRKAILEGSPTLDFVELNGLVVEAPFGTVSLDTFAVTQGDYLQALPRRTDLTMTNFSFPVSVVTDETARTQLSEMGYEQLEFSGALSLHWNTETGDVHLQDVTLKATDIGTLSADVHIGDLPLSIFDDPAAIEQRLGQATLVGGKLVFGNQSIVERTFEAQAKKLNQPADEFRKNFANAMPFMLGFLEDQALQQRFAGVLQTFFADPKSLVMTIDPAAPVSFEVMESLENAPPGEVMDLLKLKLEANR